MQVATLWPSPGPVYPWHAGVGALPTGVVTFLLTDVVDSTAMWDRIDSAPGAMESALARHDEIVAAAVRAEGELCFGQKARVTRRSRCSVVLVTPCVLPIGCSGRCVPDRTSGRCEAGIRAHSGTVQRLVGPVDLARFDATVKVPTEGSGRRSRHPGRRGPVRSLCDGPGVHSAGSARVSSAGCPDYRRVRGRHRPAVHDVARRDVRTRSADTPQRVVRVVPMESTRGGSWASSVQRCLGHSEPQSIRPIDTRDATGQVGRRADRARRRPGSTGPAGGRRPRARAAVISQSADRRRATEPRFADRGRRGLPDGLRTGRSRTEVGAGRGSS